MTTSTERTRHLLETGAFLKILESDEGAPEWIRFEARRLLRHYPTERDVRLLATFEKAKLGTGILESEFDPQWLASYLRNGTPR